MRSRIGAFGLFVWVGCAGPTPGTEGILEPAQPCEAGTLEVFDDAGWYESPRVIIADVAAERAFIAAEAKTGRLEWRNVIRAVDAAGNVAWTSVLIGPEATAADKKGWRNHGSDTMTDVHELLPMDDGGVLVVGTAGYTIHVPDLWLTRLGPDGQEQWRGVYPEQGSQWTMTARQVDGGDIVLVAGSSLGLHASSALGVPERQDDVRLLRLDSQGEVLHTSLLGGPLEERLQSATVLEDGTAGFVAKVRDWRAPIVGPELDFWLGATAPDTSLRWERHVAALYAPVVSRLGGDLVFAWPDNERLRVEGVSAADGSTLWERTLDVSLDQSEVRMAPDSAGLWLGQVAGSQLWLAHFDTDHLLTWSGTSGDAWDQLDALRSAPQGEVVALGTRAGAVVAMSGSAEGPVWSAEHVVSGMQYAVAHIALVVGYAVAAAAADQSSTGMLRLGPNCDDVGR